MLSYRLAVTAALFGVSAAHAFDIDTADPDLRMRFDITPKYSTAYRLKNPSAGLTRLDVAGDPGRVNEDDGDHNFDRGVISNRLDLLTEFDVRYRNLGFRVSGAAWLDGAYLQRNDYKGTEIYANGVPTGTVVSTANTGAGRDADEFLRSTRDQHGKGSEFLDVFGYAKGTIGDMPATVRVGRHTLQWGESLFFGQNGIANAQGPVDVAKVVSVPDWKFKEVLLPVEQVSASLGLTDELSLSAYYQLKWRGSRIPGVGSYFSNQDYVGTGSVNFGPGVDLPYRSRRDLEPRDSGQGGIQVRWSPADSNFEYGFYAAQYHDKVLAAPVFDFVNGDVHLAYAENIRTLGASVTSSIGSLNWALEGSLRWNAPLNSDPAVLVPGSAVTRCGDDDAPCFAVGRTAHLLLNGVYLLSPNAFWEGGAVLGELAYNRTLKVTKDIFNGVGGGLDGNTTKDAWALRMIFEPQYFQVLPGLDLSVPVSVAYNFGGRSSAVANFAGGVSDGGSYSVGLKGIYRTVWNFSLAYTDYFGREDTFTETLVDGSATPRQLTFGQSLKDRAYVSFSISRTF